MADRHCVVVGDVVESRNVTDRERLHERLGTGLERANDATADALRAPFATLKGVDEIGGVLVDPGHTYEPMREIAEAVHPTAIRFAVVWGEVDVEPDAGDVAAMDGPAFHQADELLNAAARRNRHVALSLPGTDDWLVDLLADQMDLVFMWKDGWTSHQMEVTRLYRSLGTMAAVAEQLDVSVQAVSQTLDRAASSRISEVERNLAAVMADRRSGPP